MTAPSSKPTRRSIDDLDVPRAPLKAGLARDRSSKAPDTNLVARVRSEFLEMRGFSPTLKQAGRLFDLQDEECRRVLAILVTEGFLLEDHDGRFRLSWHR